MYSHGACACAWGGVKDSGLGRSHSKFGFYECANVKTVAWEPSRARDFWWHPYDESLAKGLHAAAQLLYGRDADKAAALRRGRARCCDWREVAPRRPQAVRSTTSPACQARMESGSAQGLGTPSGSRSTCPA